MREIFICGVLLAMTASSAAESDDRSSGDFMLPYCKLLTVEAMKSARDSYWNGKCVGLLEGMRAALQVIRESEKVGSAKHGPICTDIPEEVASQQLVEVVVSFAKEHTEITHEDFRGLVLLAFHQEWPCK